jgi:hypothetical protein
VIRYGYPYRDEIAMKTTIDIADDLIKRAKAIQARDDVTLRSLVEEGLRDLLDRRSKPKAYKFIPIVAGGPAIDYSMTPAKVNRIIDESRDRPWDFGMSAVLRPAKRRAGPKKRRA